MSKNTNTIAARVELITPAAAKTYLMSNTNNRKVGGTNYGKIKASFIRGEWKLNGEAIKIATDGTILDGQHRLMACAETGVSFQTLIVTGLERETQDTMDTGKARTLSDVLTLHGYKNGTAVAAAVVGIIKSEKHSLKTAFTSGGINSSIVTIKESLDRLEMEPTIQESASEAKRFAKIGLQGRTGSVLHYVLTNINADDAEHFFTKLRTGEGLVAGSPILALRSQLIANKSSMSNLPQTFIAALVIKAWNKYREGAYVTQLKFRVGGANPERFPEPK